MGNSRSNEMIFEQEEQKEPNYIISVEDYWNILNLMMNKMFVVYIGTDAIKDNANKIEAFKFESGCTFDDKIDKIVQLEKAIRLFFLRNTIKIIMTDFEKNYIKTCFSRRTGNVSPALTILLIDSFIDDKYNEVAFSPEELEKQSQNVYIQLNYFLKHIWKEGWENEENINFIKVIKVYLLL